MEGEYQTTEGDAKGTEENEIQAERPPNEDTRSRTEREIDRILQWAVPRYAANLRLDETYRASLEERTRASAAKLLGEPPDDAVLRKVEVGRENRSPFSHWGLVVEWDVFHLVIPKNTDLKFVFKASGAIGDHPQFPEQVVVGHTRMGLEQIRSVGHHLILEFGDYHSLFWNCQHFVECLLRLICVEPPSDHGFMPTTDALLSLGSTSFSTSGPVSPSAERAKRERIYQTLLQVEQTLKASGSWDTKRWKVASKEFIDIFYKAEPGHRSCALF